MKKCPIFQVADLIGKKWSIVVLQEVSLNGNRGFNAISKRMKIISPKILSKRLKELEDNGIITKERIDNGISIKTRYKLTEKGQELYSIVNNIKSWSMKYSNQKLECNKKECIMCPLY